MTRTHTQAGLDAAVAQARDAALREAAGKAERWFGTPDADDIARILHADILDLRDQPMATCHKCGGVMKSGQAIAPTLTGIGDFHIDDAGVTLSVGGPGRLIDCLKCEDCGRSVTKETTP